MPRSWQFCPVFIWFGFTKLVAMKFLCTYYLLTLQISFKIKFRLVSHSGNWKMVWKLLYMYCVVYLDFRGSREIDFNLEEFSFFQNLIILKLIKNSFYKVQNFCFHNFGLFRMAFSFSYPLKYQNNEILLFTNPKQSKGSKSKISVAINIFQFYFFLLLGGLKLFSIDQYFHSFLKI